MNTEAKKYSDTATYDSDRRMTILGVEGRLTRRTTCAKTVVGCWTHQDWISERRTVRVDGQTVVMHATIRFDDGCGNRHNSFSITGHGWYDHFKSRDWDFGCCHEEITKVFPELVPLIKWHLMDTDGPMHYPGNVTYHAGDLDYNGLAKGEKRQLLAKGVTPVWSQRMDATGCALKTPLGAGEDITNLPLYRLQDMVTAEEMPTAVPRIFWEPCWKVGEGKERELEAARRSAVWPEATDEQLCLPKAELAELLEARLPALIEEFRADMQRIGFFWSPEEYEAARFLAAEES